MGFFKTFVLKYFFLSIFFSFLITSAHSEQSYTVKDFNLLDNNWKIIEKKENIIHYKQQIKDLGINAYKGICIVDKPIDQVYALMTDVSNLPSWVAYCSSSYIVKKSSDEDVIQYFNFDVPWPFLNRDIVVHCTQKTEPQTGKIILDCFAVKTPLVPLKKNHMRITDSRQQWTLEKIGSGKTRITFVSITNIESSVPGILKRLISQIIPSKSLENLLSLSNNADSSVSSQYLAKTDIKKKIHK